MISSIVYPTDLIGSLTLATDGESLVGCWFNEGRYFGYGLKEEMSPIDEHPVLSQACAWLDRYFAGGQPSPHELPLNPGGSAFQKSVWRILADIPYGQTVTYGSIAKRLEEESGRRSSARAVGGAVGHNPLCVIVPCHRVVGANGSLTGFGGGIATKVKLLEHEHASMEGLYIPKRGTAL